MTWNQQVTELYWRQLTRLQSFVPFTQLKRWTQCETCDKAAASQLQVQSIQQLLYSFVCLISATQLTSTCGLED